MAANKDWITEHLREQILNDADYITETNRADLMTITLSFQSLVKPERHVWIDAEAGDDRDGYSIDLEDWTHQGTWDNAVATVRTADEPVARNITQAWLKGQPLDTALVHATNSIVERKQ
jgi:hypothetical protein